MSIRDAWTLLRAHDGGGDKSLRMRLINTVGDLSIYAAVAEGSKNLGLVFDMPEAVRPTRFVNQSGKRVSVDRLSGPDIGLGRVAVLVSLQDKECEDLFGLLCDHLLSKVRTHSDARVAVNAVVDEIDRWRRFMERYRRMLDTQAVIGLIGELAVLERLLGRIGKAVAIAAWRSPQDSLRDFELPDATIEVKSFSTSAGGLVHINDPLQLEPDGGKSLFLACQEVVPVEDGSDRLPDHVGRVRAAIGSDTGLLGDFDRLLADSGYLPAHEPEYREGFRLADLRVFRVSEGFPRLAPSSIPLGVKNVRFALTVASLISYEVDAAATIGPLGFRHGATQ